MGPCNIHKVTYMQVTHLCVCVCICAAVCENVQVLCISKSAAATTNAAAAFVLIN